MPDFISQSLITSSLLSTIRFPTIQNRRRLDLVTDGYSIPAEDEASLRVEVQNVSAEQLARCSTQQQSALLACATASYNDECISARIRVRALTHWNRPIFAQPDSRHPACITAAKEKSTRMGTSRLPTGSRAACRALCAINRERRRERRPGRRL
jgi:hypothetical protein